MASKKTLGAATGDPWGVPSWKIAEDYKFVLDLEPARKRWEFLRRMPEYRAAWARSQGSVGGFGLRRMLDPCRNARELSAAPKFADSVMLGGPLGLAISVPPLSSFLQQSNADSDREVALHVGLEVRRLIDAGYVLFVTDPMLSATTQATDIADHLAKMQRESRKGGERSYRRNSRELHSPDKLLRVLDAYEQEGLSTGLHKRGVKTMIGKTIFDDVKVDAESHWHKLAQRAHEQASAISSRPLPI